MPFRLVYAVFCGGLRVPFRLEGRIKASSIMEEQWLVWIDSFRAGNLRVTHDVSWNKLFKEAKYDKWMVSGEKHTQLLGTCAAILGFCRI